MPCVCSWLRARAFILITRVRFFALAKVNLFSPPKKDCRMSHSGFMSEARLSSFTKKWGQLHKKDSHLSSIIHLSFTVASYRGCSSWKCIMHMKQYHFNEIHSHFKKTTRSWLAMVFSTRLLEGLLWKRVCSSLSQFILPAKRFTNKHVEKGWHPSHAWLLCSARAERVSADHANAVYAKCYATLRK
jgi:hypothetical protein